MPGSCEQAYKAGVYSLWSRLFSLLIASKFDHSFVYELFKPGILKLENRNINRLIILLVWTLLGIVFSSDKYLSRLTEGEPVTVQEAIAYGMVNWYVFGALSIFVVQLVRRRRLHSGQLLARAPAYILASVVFSVSHTLITHLLWFKRYPLSFFASPELKVHLLWHYRFDVLVFAVVIGVVQAIDHYRAMRRRELESAQLAAQLAQSRLQMLRMQIQPHFLFNTLNTIGALVYEKPDAAHDMIANLSELLRLSLDSSSRQEVTLDEELTFLEHYIEIQKARFRERLQFQLDVAPATREAMVPSMILQPLVENAIQHGIAPYDIRGIVTVSARESNGRLRLEIRDNGGGVSRDGESLSGAGVGLANCRNRLQQLYAKQGAELRIARADDGGTVVSIDIPFRLKVKAEKQEQR